MKTYILIFFFAMGLAACTQSQKSGSNEGQNQDTHVEQMSDTDVQVEAEPQDLTQYEYVCSHCQVGSHEAGKCPCGMDMEENPDFAGATHSDEESHEGHNH